MITLTTTELPTPKYTSRALAYLSPRDTMLLGNYLHKLADICATISSPVTDITVDIFTDPEENERHVVVTSTFDVDAKTALSYWDNIGNALDDWASGPEESAASDVLQLVATDLRWSR